MNACCESDGYGADTANTSFSPLAGGSRSSAYNYLALRDHPGPSGVPLGGVGVGCVDLAPDGRFTRIGLNNWFTDHINRGAIENPRLGEGCLLALWERAGQQVQARRLVRDTATLFGMRGYAHTTYRGLFPIAQLALDEDNWPQPNCRVSVKAYSGLVPHNTKDSSLPCFWVEVTLANTSNQDVEAAVALSWTDLIGRGLYDPQSMQDVPANPFELNASLWPAFAQVASSAGDYEVNQWKGYLQRAAAAQKPNKATFQNYIDQVAVLAQVQPDMQVSGLAAYDVQQGEAAWASFRENGAFGEASTVGQNLSNAGKASVVALKAKLGPAEKRTFRFLVAWYFPELKPDREKGHPLSFFGQGDYGRYFHNFFPDSDSLLRYVTDNRPRILEETQAWHTPIMESTLPDWLKFKLINSAYTMYTNTILNKAGDFTVMEGGMNGLAGTMDQRLSAHPFYQKFFTQLDRSEMQLFADCQEEDGGILHFVGHYYIGLAATGGPAPTAGHKMLDNAAGWIIQMAKDYQQTGDIEYVRQNAEHLRQALAYLKSNIRDDSGVPVGPQTYDDYPHPPVYSYMGGVYLTTLRAGEILFTAMGDSSMQAECRSQFEKSRQGYQKALWNGKFFAYGCDIGGGNRRDDRVFTGQLAGQFLSRYCGWGDLFPMSMVRSSLETQFRTSLANSPDYYAPKIWDLEMNRGVDMPGSQCWPFYLESYTAMPAIQAGYVADGLEIMKHIQLVHLRKGWTWSQNLWNPGELTYMTAPVTWFITDVLAGAALDLPAETLQLGPVVRASQRPVILPLFFPQFWATFTMEPSSQKASLTITRTFDSPAMCIRNLSILPVGQESQTAVTVSLPAFDVKAGATLDLSSHWEVLNSGQILESVLAD